MSIYSDFVRLDFNFQRLTGDKKVLDESRAIVRRNLDAASTVKWWDRYGPDRPLSPKSMAVINFAVLNDGVTKKVLAVQLGLDESTVYRYVTRANGELHERGAKALISWDGNGVARTAAMVIQKSNAGRK